MTKKVLSPTVAACLYLATPGFLFAPRAHAQSISAAPVVHNRMVPLTGNVRREANPANDAGPVSNNLQLHHMLLQLKRPAAKEAALEARMEAMHQPGSSDFHHWLTAQELGQQYGPDQADIATITEWLKSSGFQIDNVAKSGMTIDFSGTAGQVKAAFHAGLHSLHVRGKHHIANMKDPQIPAALANLIVGVSSLNDFRPKPANTGISSAHIDPMSKAVVSTSTQQNETAALAAPGSGATPGFTVNSSYQLVVPNDLHTIYNFDPTYQRGITGKGQTIVVIEDTDVYSTNDWTVFRNTFGLSKYKKGTFTQIHPGGCTDPGVVVGNDAEATLDAEYASAAAPNAAIVLASCADTQTTFGGLIALESLINQDVSTFDHQHQLWRVRSRAGSCGQRNLQLCIPAGSVGRRVGIRVQRR